MTWWSAHASATPHPTSLRMSNHSGGAGSGRPGTDAAMVPPRSTVPWEAASSRPGGRPGGEGRISRMGRRRAGTVATVGLSLLAAAPAAQAVTLEQTGRVGLSGGYERVFGIAHGTVAGDEAVRGLPSGGASYTAEYELIRPASGSTTRMLLVEAENRGSPLVLNALSGIEPGASGPPSTVKYPASVSTFLTRHRLAYARVQWQT